MKTKMLSTAGTLILASALGLTACGGGGNDGGASGGAASGGSSASPSASASGDGTAAPAGGKKVEITFWNTYNQTSAETKQLTEVVIPAFEKAHPNIKVKNVAMPTDSFNQKLLVSAAGAQLPDAARIDIVMTPQLAKLGTLVEQDSLEGFDELKAKVFPGPLATNLYNGKYYGIPLDTNTKVLLYNPELLAKAGLSGPPKTMDEFVEAMGKLSGGQGNSATYGYQFGVDLWWLGPWLWSNGADVLSPDLTKATGYMNGDKTIALIEKLQELGKAGHVTGFHNGDLGGTDGLAKGKYAMIDDGPWAFDVLKKQYPSFKFEAAQYPAGEGGSAQVVGGENFVLFKSSDAEHQAAAYEFEKFMLSDEAQIAMAKVGQMPVVASLTDHPDIKAIEYFAPYMEQMKTAKARPSVPAYAQIDKLFSDAVSQALLGKASAKDALDKAAKQADALLAP
ncbi:sugar ABC transporter substrate-binding protein [Cohnella xylanilytica]|uniref:extracellular solute-binding protein n=1 Tax=Cohnella xylanilytica TaxID=557555 RepID=UPI001B2735EB|nr:extracellular solute-binding protein [Cohnella xylanilytica]GIO16165.1 sugar ABC transporter substrate-binding protein [Cohnella xylanilytica]